MVPSYRREASQGHCLGSFPVLELLRHRPRQTRMVVLPAGNEKPLAGRIVELCERHGIDLRYDDDLLRRVGNRKDIDAFALFDKYGERLAAHEDHLVLLSPRSPGNLGTIVRNMIAFDTGNLAVVGHSVDPFSPHVIRASIGSRFLVRIEEYANLAEYLGQRQQPLHLFTGAGEKSLEQMEFPSPFTFVFGPEWPGLPADVAALGTTVSIPQSGAVESLNLGVAVGIALYAARHTGSARA